MPNVFVVNAIALYAIAMMGMEVKCQFMMDLDQKKI